MKTPSGKVLYLDPTEKEEKDAIFVGTFVYNGHSSNPVLIQTYGMFYYYSLYPNRWNSLELFITI